MCFSFMLLVQKYEPFILAVWRSQASSCIKTIECRSANEAFCAITLVTPRIFYLHWKLSSVYSYHQSTLIDLPIDNMTLIAEEKMRRKLKFFFMNPIEKWQAKRRFPYKFFVQVVKIVLVTIQLCLFAHNNYMHVNYAWDNRIAFSHLFLKGWDAIQEVTDRLLNNYLF